MSQPTTAHTVLIAARALIATTATWTTETCARNAGGISVDPGGPDAVCFCAIGAVAHASQPADRIRDRDPVYAADHNPGYQPALSALNASVDFLYPEGCGSISVVNDRNGHQAVLACFDNAIEATRSC